MKSKFGYTLQRKARTKSRLKFALECRVNKKLGADIRFQGIGF